MEFRLKFDTLIAETSMSKTFFQSLISYFVRFYDKRSNIDKERLVR
jgi:hypothetical protein